MNLHISHAQLPYRGLRQTDIATYRLNGHRDQFSENAGPKKIKEHFFVKKNMWPTLFFPFFKFFFWQTSLLCIVGELAVGGSVAVAVGVGIDDM